MRAQQMPRAEARVQKGPRFSKQSQVQQRATVTNKRTFERQNRQSPTIAFGGSTTVNRNVNVERARSFENTRTTRDFDRSDDRRRLRPPSEIWRNWDRRNIHTWNNHRYRWYNNDWVIVTGGGVYGDPSYYYPTQYYSDSYYDVPEPTTFAYSTTDGLASAVQSELARLGYNPGVIDGVLGPQTRNAIAQFQSDRRLAVTGRIDRPLLDALDLD
jgi:N-acetylmuramoyl-L-alanine amidase